MQVYGSNNINHLCETGGAIYYDKIEQVQSVNEVYSILYIYVPALHRLLLLLFRYCYCYTELTQSFIDKSKCTILKSYSQTNAPTYTLPDKHSHWNKESTHSIGTSNQFLCSLSLNSHLLHRKPSLHHRLMLWIKPCDSLTDFPFAICHDFNYFKLTYNIRHVSLCVCVWFFVCVLLISFSLLYENVVNIIESVTIMRLGTIFYTLEIKTKIEREWTIEIGCMMGFLAKCNELTVIASI